MGTQKMFFCMFSGNHITTNFTFLQITGAVSKMQVKIGRWDGSVTAIDTTNNVDITTVGSHKIKDKQK